MNILSNHLKKNINDIDIKHYLCSQSENRIKIWVSNFTYDYNILKKICTINDNNNGLFKIHQYSTKRFEIYFKNDNHKNYDLLNHIYSYTKHYKHVNITKILKRNKLIKLELCYRTEYEQLFKYYYYENNIHILQDIYINDLYIDTNTYIYQFDKYFCSYKINTIIL